MGSILPSPKVILLLHISCSNSNFSLLFCEFNPLISIGLICNKQNSDFLLLLSFKFTENSISTSHPIASLPSFNILFRTLFKGNSSHFNIGLNVATLFPLYLNESLKILSWLEITPPICFSVPSFSALSKLNFFRLNFSPLLNRLSLECI